MYKADGYANIAQLVELLICNQWVGSSSLSVGTIKKSPFYGGFFNGFRQRPRTHERREFDKEEQARRKYRRTCDDEAAEHFICEVSLSDSPHGLFFIQIPFPSHFMVLFFVLKCR